MRCLRYYVRRAPVWAVVWAFGLGRLSMAVWEGFGA